MGVIGTVIGLFAFIPYPLIFGAITDRLATSETKAIFRKSYMYQIHGFCRNVTCLALRMSDTCTVILTHIFVSTSACTVWEKTCGETGNCWLYDLDKFRVYLHTASFGLMLFGSLFDLVVICYAHRIKNMYDEDEPSDDDKRQDTQTAMLPMSSLKRRAESGDEDVLCNIPDSHFD